MTFDVITDNPMLAGPLRAGLGDRLRADPGHDRDGGFTGAHNQLWTWLLRLMTVLVIWFVGWPLWASLAQPARSGEPR